MNNTELEIWKTIEGYENYQVSNYGNVKSLNYGKEKILKQGKNKDGYLLVGLTKDKKLKTYLVHRLVATAFIENPNNYLCVNHKNEFKTDNRIDNLEWCSYTYNNNYGLHNEKVAKAKKGKKYTKEHNEKVAKALSKPILQLSKSGNIILRKWDSIIEVERELGINNGNICSCCKGKYKSAGGYKFIYLEDYIKKIEDLEKLEKK